MRSAPIVTAPVKAALLFGANWASAAFRGGSAREAKLKEGRIKAALALLAAMAHLRGLFSKLGQVLANYPNLVPAEVAEALWSLNFQSPPLHFSLVREMLRNELGDLPEGNAGRPPRDSDRLKAELRTPTNAVNDSANSSVAAGPGARFLTQKNLT